MVRGLAILMIKNNEQIPSEKKLNQDVAIYENTTVFLFDMWLL